MILIAESGCAVVKSQGHLGNAGLIWHAPDDIQIGKICIAFSPLREPVSFCSQSMARF
jgi:hypothetical protein